MTTLTATKDKGFLVRVLTIKLGWSECHLNSFSEESLNELYTYVLDGYIVKKAKVSSHSVGNGGCVVKIPKKIIDELGLVYGDRFDMKFNILAQKVILIHQIKGIIKLRNDGKVYIPPKVIEKRMLKPNDDAVFILKDDRIIVKSFTYMQ